MKAAPEVAEPCDLRALWKGPTWWAGLLRSGEEASRLTAGDFYTLNMGMATQ